VSRLQPTEVSGTGRAGDRRMIVGLIGMALGGLALARSRHTA